DCPYTEVLTALLEERIDAAVWHATLLPVPLSAMGITETPVTSADLESVSTAVLVMRRDDLPLSHLVERLDGSVVVEKQAKLLGMDPASSELHTQVWLRWHPPEQGRLQQVLRVPRLLERAVQRGVG